MSKQTLLENLQLENQRWETLLEQVDPVVMDKPGFAGNWSVKDLVAHLTGWQRRTVLRLQAALRGETESEPPWPDELQSTDEINAWIYEANRNRPVSDVRADAAATFQQLLNAISALPEVELMDPQRFAWTEGEPLSANGLFSHLRDEHEADFHAWLVRQNETKG
ncbi:MAG: ClbS/DfsB family four-helix bundle protein [Caldilineaceae bacterium]